MNIAIVDDVKNERDHLSSIIKNYSINKHIKVDVSDFESGEDFLEDFRPYLYTVVFLDIFMKELDGLETAKKIRELDTAILIVFLTESTDFMPEAFNVHAYHYLKKPDDTKELETVVIHLLDDIRKLGMKDENFFSFISERKEYNLPFSEILCVESNAHYSIITKTDGRKYKSRIPFSETYASLKSDGRFLLINRGILINMDYIKSFENNLCVLNNDIALPINIKNFMKINQIRQNYIFIKLRHKSINAGDDA